MQLKRFLVSLLIAMMIISAAVVSISADDMLTTSAPASFDVALETNVDDIKAGDTVEFSIVIKNNPGVALLQMELAYDSNAITPIVDANGAVVVESDIYSFENTVLNKSGIILVDNGANSRIIMMSDTVNKTDISATGVVAKLSFKVNENFGKTVCVASVKLDSVETFNAKLDTVSNAVVSEFVVSKHVLGEATVVTAATCTTDGESKATCSVCNQEVTTVIPATGHTYVETVVAPTCTAEGYTLNKCSVCGDEQKSDNVAALGHTEEVIAAVPGTCLANGTSEGKKCSVCGEILVAVTETTKGDHVLETYSEDGMTDGQKCSVCGEIVVPGEPISGSLLWLWIVIAVVVVAGAAAVVFFVVKKKK